MEIKFNEGTTNRPEGERVLNAPLVFVDIKQYARQLQEENAWKKNDRNGITVFKNGYLTIVLTCLHQNAEISNNTVEGLFTIHVLEGVIKMQFDDTETELSENQLLVLHPSVKHFIKALKNTVLLFTNNSAGKNDNEQ